MAALPAATVRAVRRSARRRAGGPRAQEPRHAPHRAVPPSESPPAPAGAWRGWGRGRKHAQELVRIGRGQEPRILKEAGELAGIGGVSGQLAAQVGVGGRPVAGAVGVARHGAEQALVDGLRGADRPRMLLVTFAEPVGQGLVVEPVVGGLPGDDGFDEVVGCGVQQRGDVAGGVAAAGRASAVASRGHSPASSRGRPSPRA